MKKYTYYLLVLLGMMLLTSCGKQLTYFTQNLYDEYNWSESELKQIQFYVSQDIELYRTAEGGNSTIEDGQIKVKSHPFHQKTIDMLLVLMIQEPISSSAQVKKLEDVIPLEQRNGKKEAKEV